MNSPLGVCLSVGSSVIAGMLYYLSAQLHPLTGTEMFGWRVPLALPFVTAFMVASGDWAHVGVIVGRLRRRPTLLLGLCLSSALLGIQLWLFVWAPINGAGLSVSIGYFLLPLTLLMVGRLLYRERMSALQAAAALSATAGVVHEIWSSGGVSWPAAVVALGFPAYFALRRALAIDTLGGLWFDMLLMLPAALFFVLAQGGGVAPLRAAPRLLALLPLLGFLSAAAFMTYVLASRLLPLTLFGLLSYVEPVLLFAVSLALGEAVRTTDLLTYVPIMVAVAILGADGIRRLLVGRPVPKEPGRP